MAPLAANPAAAQNCAIAERKTQRLRRLHQPAFGAQLRFTRALFQLGRQGRPDRSGAHHLRHLHHLRHIRLPEECREGECARAARRRARSRCLGLRGGRQQARAAAQGGRRLLFPAGLQGRQDGEGQGPAPPPCRGLECIRDRRPEAAQRRRSHQRPTLAGETRRDREKRRQAGALPCRSPDDPGQACGARGGSGQARCRRDHAGAQRLRKHGQRRRTVYRLRQRRQDRLVFHQQRQVVSGHGEGLDAPNPR